MDTQIVNTPPAGATQQPSMLSQLVSPADYRQERQQFFPSESSLAWFVRKHRPGLIAAGALVLLTGRWFVHPAAFDRFALDAASANAQRRA